MTKRVHKALADENLQTALTRLMGLIKFARQIAFTGIDFESLSKEIRRVKEKSIASLPQLVEQFKSKATEAGAIVYEAEDAEDANNYVLKLSQKHDVKHIVKSKSMLGEEIELREHLEQAGIKVTETDIGEWIVQLAGERPAHIVGPAVHKTIEQVAELISKATGQELGTDPQALLDAARSALRQTYIDADMGISGANIAIAETGTLTIVTNEGNGCMATTLPPVHVAVVGYEKIVSSWEDAAAIFRLLSRCTAGMKMPVYISHITGPSLTDAIPGSILHGAGGPGEVHIVLVDNGRLQMREAAEFREALYCIKCGTCLNVCPVFASLAGQTYGHIYQGGIGTVLTAFLHGMDNAEDIASLCLSCMACKEACPAGIDIPRMITKLRASLAEEKGLPWMSKVAYRGILKYPQRLDSTVKAGSYLLQPFADKDSMIRRLPYPLNSLTQAISLPAPTHQPIRDRLKNHWTPKEVGKPKVAFYSGCIAAYAYPEIGEDVINVIKEYGAEPYYPIGQACCGAPAFFAGDFDTALSLAKTNIAALEEMSPDYIVTVCPGCATVIQREYPELTTSEPEWNQRARAISDKIRDFSQLVLELEPSAEKKPSRNRKITYHDPCHLKRGIGISNEPRKLLEREGFELVEMADADACCGFGGHIVLDYPKLSAAILKRKLKNIEATGVDTVVTNCLPCVLQLRGGLDKIHTKTKVIHSAELLSKCREAT
ncbi:MAG: LUD domain-containing protein [Chloroflexota bacterium]|nr:MAG: LUD domain-containing protein [Chloroflexota bacterium]